MKVKFFGFKGTKAILRKIRAKISKSLRLELITLVAFCFIASLLVGAVLSGLSEHYNISQSQWISYEYGRKSIEEDAKTLLHRFENENFSTTNIKDIQDLINLKAGNNNINIFITDTDGNVLFSAGKDTNKKIDIFSAFEDELKIEENENSENEVSEYKCMFPLRFADRNTYLIVSGIPKGEITYTRYNSDSGAIIFIIVVVSFIAFFLFALKKKMSYIEEISNGLIEISMGNLDFRVDKKGDDELSNVAVNINHMASEIKNRIENERKAERTKSELITNVSHDLRTPLTSIMGYLGLLRMKKYENEEQSAEYLEIAYNKSERLKSLIEDLFEYTKLSNNGIALNKNEIVLNEFIDQVAEELVPIAEENSINFIREIPKEKITASIDADKMQRVFENLIINAVKYSYKPGDVKIKLIKEDKLAKITVENLGDNIPPEELSKLFDRFYRVEKSRSSENGSSGLGLAIAKSIVELHGDMISAECEGNVIRFIVCLI